MFEGVLKEDFVELLQASSVAGCGLSELILGCLKKNGVNLEYMTG